MSESTTRILHLDDNPRDLELVQRQLGREGPDLEVLQARSWAEFNEALDNARIDLILSDYTMPVHDGIAALTLAHERRPLTPFIFVSGTIGEERAIDSMKSGATDYVLKDNIQRLGPAIRRALRESRERAELLRAEEAQRTSENRLKLATEASNIGLWEWNTETNEVYFSPEWKRQIGYDDDTLSNVLSEWVSRLHPQDRHQTQGKLNAFGASTGARREAEYRMRHANGSYRWMHTEGKLFPDKAGSLVRMMGCQLDITERKKDELALRESEHKYRHLFESLGDAAFLMDADSTRILDVNREVEALLGMTRSEIMGTSFARCFSTREEKIVRRQISACLLGSKSSRLESEIARKDGDTIQVDFSVSAVTLHGRRLILALLSDSTERQRMQARLRHSQRLESIGTLAAGVAHDLNNILAPILMSTPLLSEALAGRSEGKMVATIEACAMRGSGIVKQVLTFARGIEGERVLVQVQHLLFDIANIASQTFPRAITIQNMAPRDLWPVQGDATQIHQVLLNLCVNARDAMPDGGTLTMDARNTHIDENYAAMSLGALPGDYLEISVSDTGQGIPPELRQRIFDPFFTTKGVGKGTGLGLSTAVGIVKSHRGFISVESAPGKGSVFKIFLPAEPAASDVPPRASTPEAMRGNGELILLVDDEASIRLIAQTVLQAHGYRVLLAADGTEALAVVAQNYGNIAAVITDIAMPLMSGSTLIRALRKMSPEIPIIVSTGHGEQAPLPEFQVNGFLNKPYDSNTLRHTLNAVLAGQGGHLIP
jgi:PAS domain S-box-containing protein